jgi:hypothetical protein
MKTWEAGDARKVVLIETVRPNTRIDDLTEHFLDDGVYIV